jgi:plastocyanin
MHTSGLFLSLAGILAISGCGNGSGSSLAPCDNSSSYMTGSTTINFGGTLGNIYSPACLLVAKGATVTFTGSFTVHPLQASTRGTTGNPIPSTSSGTAATATFAAAGFFPFYCTVHGSDSGTGMAGVVQVTP